MKSVWLALLTALPPGAVSLRLPKYTGCFDGDGGMYSRRELTDPELRDWVKFDQNKNVISRPDEYLKTKYGQQPKYLYHCTNRENAREIAKSGVIYESEKSNGGDAYLGDGVYFTALPADWADPDVVKANNWGWQNIGKYHKYQHRDNAFVRINFDALVNLRWNPEIASDENKNTNFCVKVPRGDLSVTLRALDAEIWFHAVDHDGDPERFWSAKRGYEPKFAKKRTWKRRVRAS